MLKIVIAAAIAAGLSVAVPMGPAIAQTPASKDDSTKDNTAKDKATMDKAAEKKAKAEARKAKKAEKKASAKAAHERQKQCGAEWKKMRADGKIEKGQTWPKYYSTCNARLKAKAA
jgi:uncharacterized protein involved in copper resistance